jgi:uncharacterized protein YukE
MAEQLKVGQEVRIITEKVSEAKPELDTIIKNGIEKATLQAQQSWRGEAADQLIKQLLPGWEQKAKGVVLILDSLVENLNTADRQFNEQQQTAKTELQNKFSALGL